jgi:putative flippase GtrA
MAMELVERLRSPRGRRLIRYSMVSVVSVVINQVTLAALFGAVGWTARSANIAANCVATVPSYVLNRRWVWGKRGRSHIGREVAPFWALSFVGLALSTWSTDAAESAADHLSRLAQTVVVNGASLTAFGLLWIGKFVIFERVLFKHRARVDEVTDG